MSYPIFPVSPLPAGMDRTDFWNESVADYDSGARQASTPFQRALKRYSIPFGNITEVKQNLIQSLVNSVKGRTFPFLMKDPYDYAVNSVLAAPAGVTVGTLQLYDTNSFFVRADTITVGSLFSSLSGYVTLGAEYQYEQDTGIFTVNTKDTTDVWGVRSMEYFRKCAFDGDYRNTAVIWNIFNAQLAIKEIV